MSDAGKALIDDDGTLTGGIDALRDIQQEHDAREQLRFLASPLVTRNVAFSSALQSFLGTTRTGSHVAVLFIDIDGLKPINDECGTRQATVSSLPAPIGSRGMCVLLR